MKTRPILVNPCNPDDGNAYITGVNDYATFDQEPYNAALLAHCRNEFEALLDEHCTVVAWAKHVSEHYGVPKDIRAVADDLYDRGMERIAAASEVDGI